MDADLKKIKKLAAFMKKAGVISLKAGEIELKLSPYVFHEEQISNAAAADPSPEASLASPYTDDEILFWSSPGELPQSESEMN